MNYLAHCYLSCSDEDLLLGNIMTDFLRKSEEPNYQGRVLDGIHLHREIDQFTDNHPASLDLRNILRPRHDKYASVVVDLIWDRLLCLNWKHFSGQSIRDFVDPLYGVLRRRKEELPKKFNARLDKMIESDFLLAYATEENMLKSLTWMDKRVNFPSNFKSAILDLQENEEHIQKLFMQFFPELITKVDSLCNC